MSDVSLIRAAPATPQTPRRRAAEAPAATGGEPPPRAQTPPPAEVLSSKTKVKTEQRSLFAFTYTFIDTKSGQIVGRYPAAPPIALTAAPGAKLDHKL